ncbi:hypothetical protein IGB42_00782 [Andreprevotia sp. IGB-42]|uniref:hypothetical protein n=1 Tax=Andreprevotia sp. IGB-42 TaxID=2497473 RepID=UPI00157E731A|nr:hypothetical protein [Andreprevotia sp. IGB-42]KAF0814727.1 hypothetical protein IGB42_00782 [Andreprevotia sp. IGB-42]
MSRFVYIIYALIISVVSTGINMSQTDGQRSAGRGWGSGGHSSGGSGWSYGGSHK